jgi:hypothetical protein
MSVPQVQSEVHDAWLNSYSDAAMMRAIDYINDEPAAYKISHMVARIFFRGIYFPPKGAWGWMKVIAQNRRPIFRVVRDCFTKWHGTAADRIPAAEPVVVPGVAAGD